MDNCAIREVEFPILCKLKSTLTGEEVIYHVGDVEHMHELFDDGWDIYVIEQETMLTYEEWLDLNGGDIQITYYETGANYDTELEEFCEKEYQKYIDNFKE
jgi:hypothetical protein